MAETQVLRLEAYGHGEKGAQPRMEDAHAFNPVVGCFVVADGLGQRQGGQYSAHEVCQLVVDAARDRRHLDAAGALRHALAMCETEVRFQQEARSLPCGTTVAALLLRGPRAHVVWCGDSRVYRLRAESREGNVTHWRPTRLTRDHRDAAGTLLRHLGSRRGGDSATPEYHQTDVRPGDWYALVTDGVWEVLGDEGVCRTLLDAQPALNARWVAEELVGRALERGGRDNATALVVQVRGLEGREGGES